MQDSIVGTLAYMAPELLKGGTSDPLSDIWALGVLLSAMVSGELPFRGQTQFELIAAILHQLPTDVPSGVPDSLRLIVGCCLSKERSSRSGRAAHAEAPSRSRTSMRLWASMARSFRWRCQWALLPRRASAASQRFTT
jgi:serine/threonine protein kinase